MRNKKTPLVFLMIVIATIFFGSINLNGSVELNLNYDYSDEEDASFYDNFNKADLYFKFFGEGLRGEFNLNKDSSDQLWVSSSEFTYELENLDLTTYWNRKSVSTDDWLKIINNEKVGSVNGLKLYADLDNFGNMNFYAVDKSGYLFNLLYYRLPELGGVNSSVLYLKDYKNESLDYNEMMGFDFNVGTFEGVKPYGEVVVSYQQDVETPSYSIEDNYLLFGGVRGELGEFEYNFNTTYISDNFYKGYSPDSLMENIYLEGSYNDIRLTNKLELDFGTETYIDRLRTNLYIDNLELYVSGDFDGTFSDFVMDGSEMSITYSQDLSIPFLTSYKASIYKRGWEDDWSEITSYKPFRLYLEGNYDLFDFKGNIKYAFGNPVSEESFQSLGELYYADISRNFDQFSAMAKVQYIQGIIEKYFTAYGEITYYVPKGNIKFYIGNGDFDNVLSFKKQIGVTTTINF